jgi:hypothetical protein
MRLILQRRRAKLEEIEDYRLNNIGKDILSLPHEGKEPTYIIVIGKK